MAYSPSLSSVRFDTNGQWFDRTTGLPNDQVFTVCGWARRRVDTNNYSSIFEFGDGAGSYAAIGSDSGGDTATLWCPWDSPTSRAIGLTYTNDQWFFWAMTSSASAVVAYIGHAGTQTLSSTTAAAIPSWTGTTIRFGAGVETSSERWNGNIFGVKVWSGRALTAYEIALERWTWKPIERRNLYAVYPMSGASIYEAAKDYGPHGRHLTIAATPKLEYAGVPRIIAVPRLDLRWLYADATQKARPIADLSNSGWSRYPA